MKVYLSGGIQGLQDPFSWRREATLYLAQYGIVTIDPLRGKKVEDFGSFTPLEIVTRDKKDILSCDIVLAEVMNPHRPYIGTSMEILYAYENLKPVVLWSEYPSYWLDAHCVRRFSELRDACDYIVAYWG